ncbi:hypothetical protein [Bacillus thuringiensis]|uniref:Uncharacterized protein n=1 Tax=Bacillus thuringiensis serovar toumanoffi TaxID=180862 RepID=A0ABD5HW95_BACTU|nr:hypothetical protein [Bacillus thuringiensis]MCR6779158.1 hypothetical protein [Bacillus thuringiensis]MCR6857226.1 hypothetical protein [Bacillus thuringiensis]MCR6867557.1 hypothetical protein [Bacillus thuringiensis]MDW9209170.1 hypothetical protein [Bacillus thuringiensis serovar toumanoffi]MED2620053.1 hypothetical protein [Bacillus thuringiensis]
MPFGIAGYAGWSGSIKQSKQKAGSVKVGNRVGKYAVVNNAKKTATKALIMRGSKALGVYGFLPDAGVFLDGYYKGYKTAYKNYKPKKNSKKSKR